MINGTSALKTAPFTYHIKQWSWEQYWQIIEALKSYNIEYLKARDEYTLFKEVVSPDVTEVSNFGNSEHCENPVNIRASEFFYFSL